MISNLGPLVVQKHWGSKAVIYSMDRLYCTHTHIYIYIDVYDYVFKIYCTKKISDGDSLFP